MTKNEERQTRLGRSHLIGAASDSFSEVMLEDVTGFLGPRAIARRAGVSLGTVTYHFPGSSGDLVEAALAYAYEQGETDSWSSLADDMDTAGSGLGRSEETAIDDILLVMAQNLEANSPSNGFADPGVEARETAFYLAAAVAPRDRRAAQALHGGIDSNRVVREAIADLMLTHRSRRWRDGVTTESAARAQEALIYGFLLIRRFDRARCTAEEYAGMAVRLFDACSVSEYVPEAPDYRDSLLVPSRIPHLDGAKRVAIAQAAAHVYEEAGWQGLTMVAVAERAGVSRPTVVANFKDRRGLAAAVWARNLPELRTAAEQEAPLPVSHAVHAHLERLATVARRDRALSAAFTEGVFAYAMTHGAPIPDDPADPRTLVPLSPLIEPAIQQHKGQFRSGNADSERAVSDTATLLTDQGLQLAMTHPSLSPSGVAERVCDTTLAGMMKRRPNP